MSSRFRTKIFEAYAQPDVANHLVAVAALCAACLSAAQDVLFSSSPIKLHRLVSWVGGEGTASASDVAGMQVSFLLDVFSFHHVFCVFLFYRCSFFHPSKVIVPCLAAIISRRRSWKAMPRCNSPAGLKGYRRCAFSAHVTPSAISLSRPRLLFLLESRRDEYVLADVVCVSAFPSLPPFRLPGAAN